MDALPGGGVDVDRRAHDLRPGARLPERDEGVLSHASDGNADGGCAGALG